MTDGIITSGIMTTDNYKNDILTKPTLISSKKINIFSIDNLI
jgi:hypothetical protein